MGPTADCLGGFVNDRVFKRILQTNRNAHVVYNVCVISFWIFLNVIRM